MARLRPRVRDTLDPRVNEERYLACRALTSGRRHNSFQEPEQFLAAGGRRGRQERVLVEGTYDINRLFATVELIKKTVITVGFVGVVVSYAGRWGRDLSGTEC